MDIRHLIDKFPTGKAAAVASIMAMLVPMMLPAQHDRPKEPVFTPQVPSADRAAGNRVFLEHADVLRKSDADSFMVLVGNVEFTKGPMFMFCDSCHYYPESESMNAFGNVRMEQGDTLFVYADELFYDGHPDVEIATLYADEGKKVKLINRDVMLETDVFIYDLRFDLGYYNVGGVLTDKSNRLSSIEGEYVPSTKEANFYNDVHLNSRSKTDTLDIYTDTLYYNTGTHIAELNAASTIVNARGTVYTRRGVYDTDSDICTLTDRPTIVTSQNQTLIADSIYYNRRAGFGEAFGNMELTDSAHKATTCGDYGYYNELRDSSYVTGHAQIKEFSQGDTLYLHGRYIETFIELDSTSIPEDTVAGTPASLRVDTCHIAVVYPRVRFFRSDLQGVCDSMRFTERDSTLRMYVNPVIWNEEQQIFGNVIELHVNDSTIDRARLPEFGFTAQHIEDVHYNQISGKEMIAYFVDNELKHLDINGNVEIIMYPEESDSTINKIVNAESSFLAANFKGRTTEKIKMWPQTTGTATPLFMAKRSLFYLSKFKWFGNIRPRNAADIFIIPDEMEELMSTAERPAQTKKQVQTPLETDVMLRPQASISATSEETEDEPEPPEALETSKDPEITETQKASESTNAPKSHETPDVIADPSEAVTE